MKRYNVRSNCLAPFAWSRMTSSIPAETPEQKARVEKIMRMGPEKNAPLAVFLASDAAKEVSGQIFGPRIDRKSTRLNSSHANISYAVFCLKKKKTTKHTSTRSSNRCIRL